MVLLYSGRLLGYPTLPILRTGDPRTSAPSLPSSDSGHRLEYALALTNALSAVAASQVPGRAARHIEREELGIELAQPHALPDEPPLVAAALELEEVEQKARRLGGWNVGEVDVPQRRAERGVLEEASRRKPRG
jgi:hypothetical protein